MKRVFILVVIANLSSGIFIEAAATEVQQSAFTETVAADSTAAIPNSGESNERQVGEAEKSNQPDQILQAGDIPGSEVRLKIVSIANGTVSSEFKVFHGFEASAGLVFPQKTLTFKEPLNLTQNERIQLLCSTGSYLSIYIKDEGFAGGSVESGYEGPYYLSMWLGYPQVSDDQRVRVSYAVKSGSVGKVGIKIGSKGQCQIAALEDVKIL